MSAQEIQTLNHEIDQHMSQRRNSPSQTHYEMKSKVTRIFDITHPTSRGERRYDYAGNVLKVEVVDLDRGSMSVSWFSGNECVTTQSFNSTGELITFSDVTISADGFTFATDTVSVDRAGNVTRDYVYWDQQRQTYIRPQTTDKDNVTALFYKERNARVMVQDASKAPLN